MRKTPSAVLRVHVDFAKLLRQCRRAKSSLVRRPVGLFEITTDLIPAVRKYLTELQTLHRKDDPNGPGQQQ